MTKFKSSGWVCIAIALITTTPAVSQDGRSRSIVGGGIANFAGRGRLHHGFGRSEPNIGSGAVVGAIITDDSNGYYGSLDDLSAPRNDGSRTSGRYNGDALEQLPTGDSNDCARRYQSYDPASGSYFGADGRRHLC
jgi:BA14K-like protein